MTKNQTIQLLTKYGHLGAKLDTEFSRALGIPEETKISTLKSGDHHKQYQAQEVMQINKEVITSKITNVEFFKDFLIKFANDYNVTLTDLPGILDIAATYLRSDISNTCNVLGIKPQEIINVLTQLSQIDFVTVEANHGYIQRTETQLEEAKQEDQTDQEIHQYSETVYSTAIIQVPSIDENICHLDQLLGDSENSDS